MYWEIFAKMDQVFNLKIEIVLLKSWNFVSAEKWGPWHDVWTQVLLYFYIFKGSTHSH